jgi:hypothetical protein
MKQEKDINKESFELIIKVGEEIGVDEFGRRVIQTKWIKPEHEINLGSMKNPKEKILEFKYQPKRKPGFGIGFFGD